MTAKQATTRQRAPADRWRSPAISRILRILSRFVSRVVERLEDRRLGIDTRGDHIILDASEVPEEVMRQCPDAGKYEPVRYSVLPVVLQYVAPQDVFVDLGCGKGRALCYVSSRCHLKKAIGVEIAPGLAEIARRNAASIQSATPLEVVEGDAAQVDVGEGTVYFLFSPFGEQTLKSVLHNIRQSLDANPRCVRILYLHPAHADVLDSCGWLVREDRVEIGAYVMLVWRSKSAVATPPRGG